MRGALSFRQRHAERERQEELKRKKKQMFHSSPAARPGEEERGTMSLKTTLFCSFFLKHETTSFWTKRAVSFKYGANMSTSKSILIYLLFISIASFPTSIIALIVGRLFHFRSWSPIYAI